MLLTPLPLADEARRDVEVAGENCLARTFALPQGADFLGGQGADGREARIVEFSHRLLVHHAGRVQPFGRFVDRGHHRTSILLSHCNPPLSEFRYL